MKKKKVIVYAIILIFSLTLLLLIVNTLQEGNDYELLWFCYIGILIIILGLFKKDSNIILSQIIILAIPDLLWIFDFFYLIFTGHTILGLANNFLGNRLLDKVTAVQHLYIVPLSLVALSKIKINKPHKNYNVLLYSLIEITAVFFLTLFFVPKWQTINCVHVSCIKISLDFLPQYLLWFIFAFSFIIISYFIITSLPFIQEKKKELY